MPSKSGTKAYRRFHFMITTQIQFCEPLTIHEISDKNAQRSKLELKEKHWAPRRELGLPWATKS
jgi:hypothetical protein